MAKVRTYVYSSSYTRVSYADRWHLAGGKCNKIKTSHTFRNAYQRIILVVNFYRCDLFPRKRLLPGVYAVDIQEYAWAILK